LVALTMGAVMTGLCSNQASAICARGTPRAFANSATRLTMLPLCADQGIGVIPWSPQARGRLTRDWDYKSIRTETDEAYGRMFKNTIEEADKRVHAPPHDTSG
jgi:aryl-alcohol dehydrogenase-like predicted oxidoreductase